MAADLLRYRRWAWGWWALAFILVGWVVFLSQIGSTEPANGGTWPGWILGIWAALLIVWLTLLGLRKRSYLRGSGSLQGWASAHVWLGLAVWALATLHCALQFGWNVHTLAYLLMCLVILSGVFGLYAYLGYPRRMAENRAGLSRDALFAELFDLNREGERLSRRCASDIQTTVRSSLVRTTLGGGALAQLRGNDGSSFIVPGRGVVANPDQTAVIDYVADRITGAEKAAEVGLLRDLLAVLCRRQSVLRRLRRDIRLQGLLKVWLYVHVPLTFALLAALTVHVISVFIYW